MEKDKVQHLRNEPDLRFHFFKSNYKDYRLEETIERITRKNKEQNDNNLTISAQYGLINQGEFFNREVASKNNSHYYLLNKGEFAYNKSYSKGYPAGVVRRLDRYDKGVVSTLYICFKPKSKINSEYLLQYFESGKLNKKMLSIAQEGARNHGLLNISVSDFFHDIKISLPDIGEQTMVSTFHQLLDKKIDLLEKKLENLKLFKKGLSEKLLNDTRIPSRKLCNFANIKMGQSPDSKSYNQNNIGLPLIQGNADIENRKVLPRNYTSSPTKICNIGDIIMTVRAPVGYVGMSDIKACIGRGVCAIKSNESQEYLYQYLLLQEDKWRKYSQGSTFSAVNSKDIMNLQVKLPDIVTQNNIANKLHYIDIKVAKVESKLLILKQFKKGLLQKMFV